MRAWLRARPLLRCFCAYVAVEAVVLICHTVLTALLRERSLAASMLAGDLSPSLLGGIALIVVRLALLIFVPVLAAAHLAYAAARRAPARTLTGRSGVAGCPDRPRAVASS